MFSLTGKIGQLKAEKVLVVVVVVVMVTVVVVVVVMVVMVVALAVAVVVVVTVFVSAGCLSCGPINSVKVLKGNHKSFLVGV